MAAVTTSPGLGIPAYPLRRIQPRVATPRGHRAASSTYWRRRCGALLVFVASLVVAGQAGAALGGSSLAAPERRPAAPISVEVRPGDTLWSIAQRLEPGEDPRPVVDELSRARGGAPLQPGEIIRWPR